MTGCAAPETHVLDTIAQSTGIENAVVFRDIPAPENDAPAGELTMPAAIRLAVARDPHLQAALARVRQAQADAHQARLLPNPILNIDIRVPHEPGSNTAFEATLTGDLVSLLQKPAQISAADKRLRVAAAEAVTQALDTMAEVQAAWLSAAAVEGEIASAQDRTKILQQLRDIAQHRLDAGEATRLDVLTLEGELADAALDLTDLEMQRTEERLGLARLIGEPRGAAAWRLALPAVETTTPATQEADIPWIDAALKKRPEIQARLWELSALGDDLTAAEFSPFVGGEMGVHTERDPEWRTGPTITLPVPLFDMGQATREKINAQRVEARHELAAQKDAIIEDIRVAFATYRHARESLATARQKLLPLHQQLLDQARRAYQAGETNLATLLLAETDWRLTQSKVLDLQEKVLQAHVKLQRAAGGAAVTDALETAATQPLATQPATAPASPPATGAAP